MSLDMKDCHVKIDEPTSLTDFVILQSIDHAEIIQSIVHGELPDQGDFLRHVAHTRARDAGTLIARIPTQDPDVPLAEISDSNDARQDRGLTTSASS